MSKTTLHGFQSHYWDTDLIFAITPSGVRASDVDVRIGFEESLSNPLCVTTVLSDIQNFNPYRYDCENPLWGSYITVQRMEANSVLQMCELEAYSGRSGQGIVYSINSCQSENTLWSYTVIYLKNSHILVTAMNNFFIVVSTDTYMKSAGSMISLPVNSNAPYCQILKSPSWLGLHFSPANDVLVIAVINNTEASCNQLNVFVSYAGVFHSSYSSLLKSCPSTLISGLSGCVFHCISRDEGLLFLDVLLKLETGSSIQLCDFYAMPASL